MAKKSSNPADAFRKAQRAKELKKNKEERKKVREAQTVKRDTRELEADIRYLKTQTDATSKTRLAELESELAYVHKTKEAYVTEHPEARDRVFGIKKPRENDGRTTREEAQKHLYDENGRLRDPKKSVYYDAVYNPFGVPPPGMPYRERTPEEQEDESEEDEDEDEDDDIVMPEGPPPTGQDEDDEDSDDSDDSDDIPLPEGPPPPRPQPPTIPSASPMRMGFGAPPAGFRPPLPRPVAVPLHAHSQGQAGPSTFRPRHTPHNRPPPMVQDPLSDAPTQTYQGHRIAQHALPARPPSGTNPSTTPAPSGETVPAAPTAPAGTGEISAAPVLRDLRKEATAFVPRGVKKRKTAPGGGIINAAPGAGEIDEEGDERKRAVVVNSGLMGKLKGVLGDQPRPQASGSGGEDDEYKRFLEGLGDLS
ncbi:hypothetical protein I302_105992 [Kwoniella bestiolae CBS 10118]|uniref:Wbp11/ELF5/Saf1 N-terminal domain-containing protein n=1 Tax=Kwoniella bestiolae CBS 10118 TaxID=1296100 RepID=A0A1B9G2Q1_9TREE|nr:hypothetical protein I302_05116 [Kwoniella bestiolae CBS 10118]OCF25302.1 hypothetical protein I302_05116 [Kwoniella bestiolae CBS 10118]